MQRDLRQTLPYGDQERGAVHRDAFGGVSADIGIPGDFIVPGEPDAVSPHPTDWLRLEVCPVQTL